MKLCRRTVLLAFILLLTGGVLSLPAVHWRLIGWQRGEAFYESRPTSYWSGRVREWTAAHYGPNPTPPTPSTWDRLFTVCGWSGNGWAMPAVLGTDDGMRFSGLWLGPSRLDEQAIPVLIELFRDEDQKVRLAAVRAFMYHDTTDRSAVTALVELWHRDESIAVRSQIAHALYRMDPESPVLAELLDSLPDE